MRIRLLCLATVLCTVASPLLAVPIQWTFSNVTFVGGGTVSGSFVYDADTNTYSAVNIVSTGSGSIPASTYIARHPQAGAALVAFVTLASGDLTGTRTLVLSQSGGALTNAGGTRALSTVNSEGRCLNAVCSNATADLRALQAGGSIVGAPAAVPVPTLSTWALVLMGVLLAATAIYTMRRHGAGETLAG